LDIYINLKKHSLIKNKNKNNSSDDKIIPLLFEIAEAHSWKKPLRVS